MAERMQCRSQARARGREIEASLRSLRCAAGAAAAGAPRGMGAAASAPLSGELCGVGAGGARPRGGVRDGLATPSTPSNKQSNLHDVPQFIKEHSPISQTGHHDPGISGSDVNTFHPRPAINNPLQCFFILITVT